MEFDEVTRNEKMDSFREEVRTWLKANVPEEMKTPIDPELRSEERYHFWRRKHREMGDKGWLYPTFPKQYGGGGLSAEHLTVIAEEFEAYGAPFSRRPSYLAGVMLVWATEEQKQKFLTPLCKGEIVANIKYTEPHSGSDLSSYESTAVRDGDYWVCNGSNAFPGGHEDETNSVYFGPLLTDKEAPRHRNLGFFIIPYPTPGLTFKRMRLVHGEGQCLIYLNDVRVPNENLIGGDHQGWQVMGTALEQEHGGAGPTYYSNEPSNNLLGYMQEHLKGGKNPGGDPVLQQVATTVYIDAHIEELFTKHVRWMYHGKMTMQWEGQLCHLYDRIQGLRNVAKIRDVMGMDGLLDVHDPRAPHGGAQGQYQRSSFILQHGGGSLNISKVVLARRLGISRTREQAAPTAATATSFSV